MVTPNIITINVRAAMFRIKTIVFFSLLLATLPVFAVSLKTVTVTGSIIPLRNGVFTESMADNAEIRCMSGHFSDGSGYAFSTRFLGAGEDDDIVYGHLSLSKSDSFRQCTKYIDSTTGDIFWAFIGYERCNYVIGKTSENGSPLYYALLRNSNGSKFLFFTDQEGYETLIGQITRIENTYILDVATRRTDVSTIRNTLATYGLYFPDITIQ